MTENKREFIYRYAVTRESLIQNPDLCKTQLRRGAIDTFYSNLIEVVNEFMKDGFDDWVEDDIGNMMANITLKLDITSKVNK